MGWQLTAEHFDVQSAKRQACVYVENGFRADQEPIHCALLLCHKV